MKLFSLAFLALAGLWCGLLQAQAAEAPDHACVSRTAAAADALVRGDYAAVSAHFSPAVKKQLTTNALKRVWTQIQDRAGAYRSHAAAAGRTLEGKQAVVITPMAFADASMDLVTACDAHDRITAFRIMPASMIDLLAHSRPARPLKAHVEADGARVRPMAVASPLGPLKGALTLPAGKGVFPAVVLVSGSGPNDMDETIGPNTPMRDLADGLAKAGIASLRYDKRTRDYASHWGDKGGYVIDSETTDDALNAVHALARIDGVDPGRVFVLGHSLGAMMAPRIGKRDPHLAGLIMMAAPARSLLDVMAQQTREQSARQGLSAASVKQQENAIASEQKRLAQAAASGRELEGDFMGAPQSYWQSMHAVHQVTTATSLSMPMLILQGKADFQVSPTLDFARWKQALAGRSNVTYHLYPGLSHLFMSAGKTGTVADYAKPGHVAPQVVADIAAWIKKQPAQ